MSETLEIFMCLCLHLIERFNTTIPQTPENKLKEPPLACDLNVRSACPFSPNIGKPATKSLTIELPAQIKSGIYTFKLYRGLNECFVLLLGMATSLGSL